MSDLSDPELCDILAVDDTLPIDPRVKEYWLRNLRNPLRRNVLSLMRVLRTPVLYLIYFIKRLPLPQFRAHRLLQRIICRFMEWFVTPEASFLILNHFWTESNVINFVIANSKRKTAPVALYPETIDDLMTHSFVRHDIALFTAIRDLGSVTEEEWPVPPERLDFSLMRPIAIHVERFRRHVTQFVDFETAHELFKVTFCLLLRADEYERAINSFQFDQTLALRIGRILGEPEVAELAANRFPLLLVGPTGLGYRFILHGLFVEHVHEYLVRVWKRQAAAV